MASKLVTRILSSISSSPLPSAAATASTSSTSSSATTTATTSATTAMTSFGFSGGGFLACYHLGAAHCLVQHGWLMPPGQPPSSSSSSFAPPTITGVSAGSLVVAAVATGANLEVEAMEACQLIAQRSKKLGGYLDCLKPGFSLVDQVEDILPRYLRQALGGSGLDNDDYDNDLLMRRIDGGRLLRIGLTDHRAVFPPVGYNPTAYVYVDGYRNVDDIVAACTLSCFVPGLTGPARGSWSAQNGAVGRSYQRVEEMASLGFIKQGTTGQPLVRPRGPFLKLWQTREAFWDGGLVNVFPTVDDDTVIISPISADFRPHPSISPDPKHQPQEQLQQLQGEHSEPPQQQSSSSSRRRRDPLMFRMSPRAQLYLSQENAITFRYILLSSSDKALQERFQHGYDDAHRFLQNHGLLRTFTLPSAAAATPTTTTSTAIQNDQHAA